MSIYNENRHAHSIGWSTWHFEWCTKYRYEIFKQEKLKNLCITAIQEAAKRHDINVIEMEVDKDHVHVIASIPMTIAPTTAINKLKGLSAKFLFTLIPKLRRRYPKGHLWSPGKFIASIGHITLETAKKYLEDHHTKFISILESPLVSEANKLPEGQPFRAGRMSNI